MLGVIIDECDWQDGKKGFNESDDEDDDDEDDFDGIFGDGAGSFLKASQDCLASQSEVGFISVTYWVTVMDRVILFIANSFQFSTLRTGQISANFRNTYCSYCLCVGCEFK